jgi:hypothetical protein
MAESTSGAAIFVDGPFVTHNAALADAASLQVVEKVETGGLYVVYGPLTANGITVTAIDGAAGCLSAAVGQGTLPAG